MKKFAVHLGASTGLSISLSYLLGQNLLDEPNGIFWFFIGLSAWSFFFIGMFFLGLSEIIRPVIFTIFTLQKRNDSEQSSECLDKNALVFFSVQVLISVLALFLSWAAFIWVSTSGDTTIL